MRSTTAEPTASELRIVDSLSRPQREALRFCWMDSEGNLRVDSSATRSSTRKALERRALVGTFSYTLTPMGCWVAHRIAGMDSRVADIEQAHYLALSED